MWRSPWSYESAAGTVDSAAGTVDSVAGTVDSATGTGVAPGIELARCFPEKRRASEN